MTIATPPISTLRMVTRQIPTTITATLLIRIPAPRIVIIPTQAEIPTLAVETIMVVARVAEAMTMEATATAVNVPGIAT